MVKQNEFIELACNMLIRDEGLKRIAYDDATGVKIKAAKGNVTIGVGHNLDANPLTNEAIFCILNADIKNALSIAQNTLGYDTWEALSQNRKLAMVNLAFSLGPKKLATFKRLIAAIKVKNWALAGIELSTSLWASQVDPRKEKHSGRDYRVMKLLVNDVYEY